jgi:SAM-dependent methyltransferase
MRLARPERRLAPGNFWAAVDAEHNRLILERLPGTDILDVGCGYGSLTDFLARQGKRPIGVDSDRSSIAAALALYPERHLIEGTFEGRFPDRSFDHVVLRDALHHLVEEGDVRAALREIRRILRPGGTLVAFDPNIHAVLRACRRMMRHQDAECSLPQAHALLAGEGFDVRETSYHETFALAASGGYVGLCFVPPGLPRLHRTLVRLNRWIGNALARTPLGPHVLWRYRIVAAPH